MGHDQEEYDRQQSEREADQREHQARVGQTTEQAIADRKERHEAREAERTVRPEAASTTHEPGPSGGPAEGSNS